jgi:hypothetical protein
MSGRAGRDLVGKEELAKRARIAKQTWLFERGARSPYPALVYGVAFLASGDIPDTHVEGIHADPAECFVRKPP